MSTPEITPSTPPAVISSPEAISTEMTSRDIIISKIPRYAEETSVSVEELGKMREFYVMISKGPNHSDEPTNSTSNADPEQVEPSADDESPYDTIGTYTHPRILESRLFLV